MISAGSIDYDSQTIGCGQRDNLLSKGVQTMRQITKTVYTFTELSPEAQAKAIDWYRNLVNEDPDWAAYVLEDADEIAKLLGIQIDRAFVTLMNGTKRAEPDIGYSLHVQGSGCSFPGSYEYQSEAVKLVAEYAPQDTELLRIAQGLLAIQAKHDYRLTAVIEADGREVYSGATRITVYKDGDEFEDAGSTDGVVGYLRAFMDWVYDQLNKEYDYQSSDETIADNIEANEYEFYEDGRRA
jgi:hypothetical protein